MTSEKNTEKAKGNADGIPIYCTHDAVVPLAELKPNPKNPNKHPSSQIDLLARIIEQQGWRAPVTVSTKSGYIVKGHGRYMAAQRLNCPVPVDYQHYDSAESELADLIADNSIAELSHIDTAGIDELLKEIDAGGLSLELAGYENYILDHEVGEAVEKIQTEQEYKPAAEDKAAKAKERIGDMIDRLAEEQPERLAKALAVVIPKTRGTLNDCIIIADDSCADIVAELKRYADEQVPSPLEKLMSQIIRYEKDA